MTRYFLSILFWTIPFFYAKAFQTPGGSSSVSDEILQMNKSALGHLEKNRLNEAESDATAMLDIARQQYSFGGEALALDNLGRVAQARFDYTNAMNYYVEAMRLKESLNDTRSMANSQRLIGQVFHLQNNETKALEYYQAALHNLGEDKSNLAAIAETYQHIGDVYLSQGFYGKAIYEFDRALKIWSEDLQNIPQAASLATLMGKVNLDMNDTDAALISYNAALSFHRQINDESGMATDFLNLSKAYTVLNDNALAIENAENAQVSFEKIGDQIGMAAANYQIGKVHLLNQDPKLAASYLDESGKILRGLNFQPTMPSLFKNLSDTWLAMGETEKALACMVDYARSKDSLFNSEKGRALIEMTAKYESAFAVKDKTRQLALLEKERSVEMKVRYLLIGLVVFALAAFFLLMRNYQMKKEDNKKLSALNAQIQLQNEFIKEKSAHLAVLNDTLLEKNTRLDLVNLKLVEEVSERELAQQAHFSKDHYLADISSRMGTPLSILVNQAKNLMHAKPRKDQQEHIRQLQFAANNLWVLINDALRFSNIEAGKLSLSNEDFVVADILEEVKRDIKPVKNVALNWHTDSRMPEYLNGDSVRLTQILTYLVGNIQKQITEGLIRTTISRNEVVANEVTMKVDVVSTGQILKNEKLETLLNGANTTSEYLKDLNANDMEWLTARRLVELQNGSVQFSDQNEATHITLFLPFRLVNSGENVADTEGAAIWANNNFLEGKRILVVEDNKINQMLVVNMLKKRDARITTANDGLEALDAIANADFDLILMDIQMPRMDGYRAVAEIRRLKNPQKAAVPIIALTASAYINEKEKAQLFGMTDHIGKPFSPDELLEKVVRILMTGQHKTAEIPHMAMSMN